MKDALDKLVEENLEKIMELLRAELAKVFPCLEMLKTETFGITAPQLDDGDDEDDETPFHECYTRMHRLPKDFAKAYMANLNPDLETETLNQVEKAQSGSVRAIFYSSHGIVASSAWPRFAHDKRVFRQAFADVHVQLGERLKSIKFTDSAGKTYVDWNKWGVYRMEDPNKTGKLTHVCHVATKESAELDIALPGEYKLLENWDDLKAKVQYCGRRRS